MKFWKKKTFYVVFWPENVYLYAPKIVVSICMVLILKEKNTPRGENSEDH
jgi:hypothetical protein